MREKIIILGASGMLGSMVADYFSGSNDFDLICTVRSEEIRRKFSLVMPQAKWILFDANSVANDPSELNFIKGADWLVNCIGITKPYCADENPYEIERALRINSLFPHILASEAHNNDLKVIQIATNYVFSGARGSYSESDKHDALDVYGKTKSLGEVYHESVYNLRCSIVGPEAGRSAFLLEWFRNLPPRSQINGFLNHSCNGLTSLHFAKICMAIINNNIDLTHITHITPADKISKYKLLLLLAKCYKREDIVINPMEAGIEIDRTLVSNHKKTIAKLWQLAGYENGAPTIEQMANELCVYPYKFKDLFK